jgi:hypothetical protein
MSEALTIGNLEKFRVSPDDVTWGRIGACERMTKVLGRSRARVSTGGNHERNQRELRKLEDQGGQAGHLGHLGHLNHGAPIELITSTDHLRKS